MNHDPTLEKIIDFANQEKDIRVVMLNGSRINRNVTKDFLQDYDLVFFINNLNKNHFNKYKSWLNSLGDLVINQDSKFSDGSYITMMQFSDYLRVDLNLCDSNEILEKVKEDTLSKILLDKDNIIKSLPIPNDSIHYIKKPSENEFDGIINEFLWLQPYIAKAVLRDELPLAKHLFDSIIIECLKQVLIWKIGFEHNWEINIGKNGRWLKKYLSDDFYSEFIKLYPSVDYKNIWLCSFESIKFMRKIGLELSKKLEFVYPIEDEVKVYKFMRKLKSEII